MDLISEFEIHVERVVNYINDYCTRQQSIKQNNFKPIKVTQLFVSQEKKLDNEALSCLTTLLKSKIVRDIILSYECAVNFQLTHPKRELIINSKSFINFHNKTRILEEYWKNNKRKFIAEESDQIRAEHLYPNEEVSSNNNKIRKAMKPFNSLCKRSKSESDIKKNISAHITEKYDLKPDEVPLVAIELLTHADRKLLTKAKYEQLQSPGAEDGDEVSMDPDILQQIECHNAEFSRKDKDLVLRAVKDCKSDEEFVKVINFMKKENSAFAPLNLRNVKNWMYGAQQETVAEDHGAIQKYI